MDRSSPVVAAFILAGGKSTRMGADKAFVTLQGRTLLERALEVARAVASDVRIVGDAIKFGAFAPVVEDVFPECGPLGGIHAALCASAAALNLMLAVDVPFISPALLRFLMVRAHDSAALVTAARVKKKWQPLCAVYRHEFYALAESALRQGHYKIDALFDAATTLEITEKELQGEGFSADAFRNLNTREDLKAVRESVDK